jgi:hypothetical protein
MHLTLKKEVMMRAGFNLLLQESLVEDSVRQYNHDQPHQAPNMKYLAEAYTRSPRVYRPEDPE